MTVVLVTLVVLLGGIAVSFRPVLFLYYAVLVGPFPLALLVEDSFAQTPVGRLEVSALKVLAILIASLVGMVFGTRHLWAAVRSFALFWLFLLFATLSLLWTPSVEMGLRMLLKLATPLVFATYVCAHFHQLWQHVLRAVVVSGIVYVAFAWVATLAGWTPFPQLGIPETSPSVTSGQFVAALSVVAAGFAVSPGLGNLTLIGVVGGSILACFTRITIGGMFASLGAIAFFAARGPVRVALPIVGMLVFVGLFTLVDSFRERMFLEKAGDVSMMTALENPVETIEGIGGSGRFAAWQFALDKLFEPSPVTGSGVGATQRAFYDPAGNNVSAVHSEIIRLLCDLGVVGLVLYLAAWAQLVWAMVRRAARSMPIDARRSALAGIGATTSYLVYLLTDNGLDYVAQIGVFVFALVGAAVARLPDTADHDTREDAPTVAKRVPLLARPPRPRPLPAR